MDPLQTGFDTVNGLLREWGTAAIQAKYVQPYETRKIALQTLGEDGLYYAEGQRGAVPVLGAGGFGGGLGVLLLIGVAAIIILRD